MPEYPDIAAVVVLYHPTPDLIENIRCYSDQVRCVYAIDNSEMPTPATAEQVATIPKARYIANGGNLGIARALNIAAEMALRDGYEYLLTMDQDSRVTPGMLPAMLACIAARDPATIGIVAPVARYAASQPPTGEAPCEELLVAITSGNLLSLAAYRTTGPFRDELFIDSVDYDYCMQLRLKGFLVIQANRAELIHKLGAITEHSLFGVRFAIGNHPPIRRYYGARNKFFLRARYRRMFPRYFRPFFKYILFEIATTLLYESDALGKLRMMGKGYCDYLRGKTGKYAP